MSTDAINENIFNRTVITVKSTVAISNTDEFK